MIKVLTALSLLFSVLIPFQALALDKCQVIKKMEARLHEDRDSLGLMRSIHHDQIAAREIQQRLLHGEDVREIGLLAEAIEEEVLGIETEQQKQAIGFTVSTGSLIVASYIFKRINADSRGLALKTRLFRSIGGVPGKRLAKLGVNSALLISLSSTVYLAYQWNINRKHKNYLKDLVFKLNSIRDLAEDIITLRNKIENDTVNFELKIEELEDLGILEIHDGKIICL